MSPISISNKLKTDYDNYFYTKEGELEWRELSSIDKVKNILDLCSPSPTINAATLQFFFSTRLFTAAMRSSIPFTGAIRPTYKNDGGIILDLVSTAGLDSCFSRCFFTFKEIANVNCQVLIKYSLIRYSKLF